MKIRRRDSTMAEVDDTYILADGEVMMVPLNFMDAMGRPVIHNALGRPAGQRPGFLLSDSATDEAVRATVYQMYDDAVRERWRSDRWQGPPSKPAPSEPQPTFDSSEAARAHAYREYDRAIQERWQRWRK